MDYKIIQELIKSMNNSSLTELEVSCQDITIKMKKGEVNVFTRKNVMEAKEANDEANLQNLVQDDDTNYIVIKSPIVGMFYSSPGAGKDPFVKTGQKVKKGQVLCIIEAMKLMNEIESEIDGEIAEVLIENEMMVEYGQPLFKIKKY